MNYNTAGCNSNLKNMGVGECSQVLGTWEGLHFTTDDFEFATSAGVTESAFKTGIQDKNIFSFPIIHGLTNSDTEDSTYTSANGVVTIPTAKGKWVKDLMFQIPAYLMSNLYSFDGFSGRAIVSDSYGNLIGTTPDQTKFKGFSVKNVRIGKATIPESKDGIVTVMVTIEFDNVDEYTKDFAVTESDWIDNINGLQDVTYTVVSSSATEVIVLVSRDSDGSGVAGLVDTDMYIETDAGVDVPITGIAASTTTVGQYALTVSTMASGDYVTDLNTPATMTTQGYESTTSATFTIV